MGTAVMGPVAGGRLSVPSEVIAKATGVASTAEVALRFVWANPGVDIALSGMETAAIIDENVATASRGGPLTADELANIDRVVAENQKLLALPCTGCGYCTPCPKGVAIPEIFRFFQWHTAFDLKGPARQRYSWLGTGWQEKQKPASACEACGQCEPKCPQKIAIVEKLREAHRALGEKA
jgi:predicted aldo/keto reductase-like oxidoreductase